MSLSTETSFWIILGIIALQIMKFTYHGNYFGGRRRKTNCRVNQSKRASLWIKKHSSSWSCAFPFRWYHGSVDAHQSVLNSESANTAKAPYIIEEPEISKAIFSELKGKTHYYRIDSDSKFKFYAGITVPKIDDCPLAEKFSFEVLDTNFRLIERKDGENFNWWPWYKKHGEKWYWIGPEIGEKFKSNRVYK